MIESSTDMMNLFGDEKNLFSIADRLDQMTGDSDVEKLRGEYCGEILYEITEGYG